MIDYQKLSASNLCKAYGKRMVVNNVSLDVARGEVVGLLGPNGAGKTTSFYMITGMIPPLSGEIFLDSSNITNMPMYKRAQNKIGYLAQEPSVFTKLTVEDNINLVLETMNLTNQERKDRLEALLEEFSIAHIRKSKAFVLSGGERRRTEIARCLVTNPNFILLDEPFAGIDPIAVEDIQKIIKNLKDKNIGILITDHNVRETLTITDRSYLLYNGQILKSGSTNELINDEEVKKLYLGSKFKMDIDEES
ncbi:MAG: LPS export ABC transporter ATP-binding protein [Candidatus Marinimicrobia bacterium]|nr:LPS export ABC transporter ATP-binding protein [Candidatus Neomarinimicrobiota bacterium]|tara:strand:+ start:7552 stop:8301 length:750 start_codon:yes stop_codon:yes gene_type:complete